MATARKDARILLIGVGNTLMQDDGVGIHLVREIESDPFFADNVDCVDGGTIGLALLPQLEDAHAVIMVDASELNANPGRIAVFHQDEINRQLAGKRRTVHEVALAELISAAGIRGRLPQRRALVAVQPQCTDWGLELSPPVQAALPAAVETVRELAREWINEAA